jgi:hypothetical protein
LSIIARYPNSGGSSNDASEASKRYLKFNIPALLDAAVQSSRNHVQRCITWYGHILVIQAVYFLAGIRATKLREGQYNKTFLLTFDDHSEVIAKLPNPN